MLAGDSVAYTLFPGLVAQQGSMDLEFVTAADAGCPLDVAATAIADDHEMIVPQLPPECDWPTTWPALVERARPDVVVTLWGLWDAFDHEVDGAWLRAGTEPWQLHMERQLEQAVDVLTARGAHVVVLEAPYVHSLGRARVDALNLVFRTIAERRPDEVTVVDLQPAVDDSASMRWDGVHFTESGAATVAARIAPLISALAHG